MVKGRNTTVVSIRLADSVVFTLEERAHKQGIDSVSEYIKEQITKTCSVNTNVVQPVVSELQQMIDNMEVQPGATEEEFIEYDADGNRIWEE